jgi:hypothetical protein
LLQDYLSTKGQSETQIIGTSPAPKLSQWISMRIEGYIPDEQNVASVVWLLRDDGSVWKWPLVEGQNIQQVMSFQNIVSLHTVFHTHMVVALDKAGNAYQLNTQTNQLTLIDSAVKQITGTLYLKQNGVVLNWDGQVVSNIPLMSRLVGTSKDMFNVSGGVAKSDSQLYYFQYDTTGDYSIPKNAVKLFSGKYSQAQLLLTDKPTYNENASPTNPQYPAAILNGDTWHFLNNQGQIIGQPQKLPLGTVYAHMGGGGIRQWSPVFAGDGKLWYWSASSQSLVESSCTNIKKMHLAEVVLASDGTIRPIVSTMGGVGNVSCPESTSFNHLTGKTVVDVFILIGKRVVAITSDKKMVAYAYDPLTLQGKEPIYTVSEPQK